MKDMDIKNFVYKCLADCYETDIANIDKAFKSQTATMYLLIWPTLEKVLFDRYAKYEKIEEVADKYQEFYAEMEIEQDVRYFYDRYQDKEKYRQLRHSRYGYEEISDILNKRYELLSLKEKLQLMLFVVYRYRNNIFHGSKGLESWIRYSLEIEKCLLFMAKIISCHTKHFVDSGIVQRII